MKEFINMGKLVTFLIFATPYCREVVHLAIE